MKKSIPLFLLFAAVFGLFLTIAMTACDSCKNKADNNSDTSANKQETKGIDKIDSATAKQYEAAFMHKHGLDTGIHADSVMTVFNDRYSLKYSIITDILKNARATNINIYNAINSTGEKCFAIVPSDGGWAPLHTAEAETNYYLQNKTGICPQECDIAKTLPDIAIAAKIPDDVITYAGNFEKAEPAELNSIHIPITLFSIPATTEYIQMVWAYDPGGLLCLNIHPYDSKGVAIGLGIVSLPKSYFLKETLK